MAVEYDVVILGGGTGGYVTAVRAAQLGLKTAIVEKDSLGGTCLHKGCIPTKALLKSASVYQEVKNAHQYGVNVEKTGFDITKAMERKNNIIDSLHNGVSSLIKREKIDVYNGYGRILGPSIFSPMSGSISVEYKGEAENDILVPKNVIIATGSSPRAIPGFEADGDQIITSDHALQLETLPSSIVIVGAGVIGIEWATFFHDVGVQVTLIEAGSQILPSVDKEVAEEMKRLLKRKGIHIYNNATVDPSQVVKNKDEVNLTVQQQEGSITLTAEKILVAVGRNANTKNIGLENTDIKTNDHGFIEVNGFYQTKESHIYAIGDVNGGKQLAHAATYEGSVAVEHLHGKQPVTLSHKDIPTCIYGSPQIAAIGLTEEEASELGYEVQVNKTSFQSIGKAHVNGEVNGFAKIILDKESDDLLGIHMVGEHVTELIGQASMAKYFDGSGLEISEVIYPHPTLSEILGEVALAAEGRKIHG
ncbi:dihydrolipoyl dehydrogenase [Gracilibacillus sp. YIM 98692]|uniref:dihydrolipoyl dehydrogenase n=1 Tax=Gracilibacillus sp. YIM 98692 TaxID=2663532 RepID=UPI0013D191B9|nr:dihydrolipoyl dehydrogenase [Gracilibacillus sp. YIM 98692]